MANNDQDLSNIYSELQVEIDRLKYILTQSVARNTKLTPADVREPSNESNLMNGATEMSEEMDSDFFLQNGGNPASAEPQSPLQAITDLLELTAFERDVLLLAFAQSVDPEFGKLFAAIQNDPGKPYLNLNVLFNTFASDLKTKHSVRQTFAADGPLLRFGIIRFENDPMQLNFFQLFTPICIDDRITNYLMASVLIDPTVSEFVSGISTNIESVADASEIDESLRNQLTNSFLQLHEFREPAVFYMHGPSGTGKKSVAMNLIARLGMPVISVDLQRLLMLDPGELQTKLFRIRRECILFGAILLIPNLESIFVDELRLTNVASLVFSEINNHPNTMVLTSNKNIDIRRYLTAEKLFLVFKFPNADLETRTVAWTRALESQHITQECWEPREFAARFKLNPGRIQGAVRWAKNLALMQGGDQQVLSNKELVEGCHAFSNYTLDRLAKRIETGASWDDIVLPKKIEETLREACVHMRRRDQVYEQWGFESKYHNGRSLNIFFSGPSGTGKTMAANIIATELGLVLYKIDLSTIISKYIGETEKNLGRIFDEAESSNAILFFDEADALFGKRSEVTQSQDRYANIEVGYLLQKMEDYQGMTILATNLQENIDTAFTRRLHFMVDFGMPEEHARLRIWRNAFPSEAPLAGDIDFELLATMNLSGANIKTISVSASFLAAEDGNEISMMHIINAARRESEKEGKSFNERVFAHLFESP